MEQALNVQRVVTNAVESYVNYLYRIQNNFVIPFFQNDIIVILIASIFVLMIMRQPNQEKTEKLFERPIYRLLWILMIILLTLYRPFIGVLSAITYLNYVK